MRVHLMFRDHDFDTNSDIPWNASELTQDMELQTLLHGMAQDDAFIQNVALKALLLAGCNDISIIRYRQDVLKDCISNPSAVKDMYRLAVETVERKDQRWLGIFSRYPSGILHDAICLMEYLTDRIKKLRDIARTHSPYFTSEGFLTLFAMLERELNDEYIATIRTHLSNLKFPRGILLSAELGGGNEGANYVLRYTQDTSPFWLHRMFSQKRKREYAFQVDPRDEAGLRILADIQDQAINPTANALAQSSEHVSEFFSLLRTELAFYIGCTNLYELLHIKGEPICFPRPTLAGERRFNFHGLYDPSLSLLKNEERVKGNSVNADGKMLLIITGANQGGKTVFLRSIGLAQLMMQSGMFVTAESFEADICSGVFTHFRREEDDAMQNGKLDEELQRMSDIVNHIEPNALLLCNESFSATNDREGSEIARQIVKAFLESRIKIVFVTHLNEFAQMQLNEHKTNALFLRAERKNDGIRTFRLIEGEPLETSYGEDVYREVFSTVAINS